MVRVTLVPHRSKVGVRVRVMVRVTLIPHRSKVRDATAAVARLSQYKTSILNRNIWAPALALFPYANPEPCQTNGAAHRERLVSNVAVFLSVGRQ